MMMDIVEFIENVILTLKEYYGNDAEVLAQKCIKTNDVVCIGVSVFYKNKLLAPIVYLDSYYEQYSKGMDFDLIIEHITDIIEENQVSVTEENIVKNIINWNYIEFNIYPMLISTKRNKNLLADLVHREILDLSIIYVVRFSAECGKETLIRVTKKMLNSWNRTEDELHNIALVNMNRDEPQLFDLNDIIDILLGNAEDVRTIGDSEMYVLTCHSKRYAAAKILDKELMKRITGGKKCYMIPSSIHEWIILPITLDKESDLLILNEMVCEVNEEKVEPNEILSDHIYMYDDGELKYAQYI